MNLLLSSNSTLYGEPYLAFCKDEINSFLARHHTKNIIFIPFAAVSLSYDEYEKNVVKGLKNDTIDIQSIHHFENKTEAIRNSDAIIVGGGNTFHLLHEIYKNTIYDTLIEKIKNGTPYVGWSAGSNLACPTIKTTNDMPIIEPPSFKALHLVNFQINPHYLDKNPSAHNGETREQRITEFLEVNKNAKVVGLREGSLLLIENDTIKLKGNLNLRLFEYQKLPKELNSNDDLSSLLQ